AAVGFHATTSPATNVARTSASTGPPDRSSDHAHAPDAATTASASAVLATVPDTVIVSVETNGGAAAPVVENPCPRTGFAVSAIAWAPPHDEQLSTKTVLTRSGRADG